MGLESLIDLASSQLRAGPAQPGAAVVVDGARIARPMPGLSLLQYAEPTALEATLYEPVICLILRGRKEVTLGDRTAAFGSGECLLVTHDLPVVSKVTDARPKAPYLALILSIDVTVLRGLYEDLAELDLRTDSGRSLDVFRADDALIESLTRYLRLADSPAEARVLGPLLLKELHYRLLAAPSGHMLRALLRHDSAASQVARAIGHIRRDFRQRIAIPTLARSLGMSQSSFHQHFKTVTSTTPLQYQKQLRLLEARRLLVSEGRSVSEAAYEVGYESPTQFSREYSRKFGAPPAGARVSRGWGP